MLTTREMLKIINDDGRSLLEEIKKKDFDQNIQAIKDAEPATRLPILLDLMISKRFLADWRKASVIMELIHRLPSEQKTELMVIASNTHKVDPLPSQVEIENRRRAFMKAKATEISPHFWELQVTLGCLIEDDEENNGTGFLIDVQANLNAWLEMLSRGEACDEHAKKVVGHIAGSHGQLMALPKGSGLPALILLALLPHCKGNELEKLFFHCLEQAMVTKDIRFLLAVSKVLKELPQAEFGSWYVAVQAAIVWFLLRPSEGSASDVNAELIGQLKAYLDAVLAGEGSAGIFDSLAVSVRKAEDSLNSNPAVFTIDELLGSLPLLLSREFKELAASNHPAGFVNKVSMLLNAGQFKPLFKAIQSQDLLAHRSWVLRSFVQDVSRFASFPELTRLILFVAKSMPRSVLIGVFSDEFGLLDCKYLQAVVSNPETTRGALAMIENMRDEHIANILTPRFASDLLCQSMSLTTAYYYNPTDSASLFLSHLGKKSYILLAKAVYASNSPSKDRYHSMLELIISKRKDLALYDRIAQAMVSLEVMIEEYSGSSKKLKESERKKLPVCQELLMHVKNVAQQVDVAGQKVAAARLLDYMEAECRPRNFNPLALVFSGRWQDLMVRLEAIAQFGGRLGVDALSHFTRSQWSIFVNKATKETDLSRLIDVEKDIDAIQDPEIKARYFFDVKLAQAAISLHQFVISPQLKVSDSVAKIMHVSLSFFEQSARTGAIDSVGLANIKQLVAAVPELSAAVVPDDHVQEDTEAEMSNQALLVALNKLNHKLSQPWPDYPGICEPVLSHESRRCDIAATGSMSPRLRGLSNVSVVSDMTTDSVVEERRKGLVKKAMAAVRGRVGSGASFDSSPDDGVAESKARRLSLDDDDVDDALTPRSSSADGGAEKNGFAAQRNGSSSFGSRGSQ